MGSNHSLPVRIVRIGARQRGAARKDLFNPPAIDGIGYAVADGRVAGRAATHALAAAQNIAEAGAGLYRQSGQAVFGARARTFFGRLVASALARGIQGGSRLRGWIRGQS